MRPRRLTLRGFRSYADEQTFDFTDRRLVGVVGPIGSGKSSLLDAVSFALYGKTPKVERDTKTLINQRHDTAHVELWFEAGGQSWRAVRALRRAGAAAHNLYRYAGPEPDAERVEEVLGARDMTARVEELLGLDFAGFGRSVLLAQNQFAAFLNARPAERDAVLKGVFGFEKIDAIRDLAKQRRDAADRDLDELDRRRRDIEQDKVALGEARPQLAEATGHVAMLEQAEAAITEADEALKDADSRLADAGERIRQLAAVEDDLPTQDVAAGTLDQSAGAAAALATAESALADAKARVAAAESGLAAAVAEHGGRDRLERARVAVSGLGERVAVAGERRREVAGAEADLAAAVGSGEEADAAAAAAASSAEDAREAAATEAKARVEAGEKLHEARHADMAAALRSGLVVGESCPVCDRPIAGLPGKGRPPALAAAERRLEKAKAVEAAAAGVAEKAATAAADARSAQAVAAERVTSMTAAHERAIQALAGAVADEETAAAAVVTLVGDGAPAALLAAWEEVLDAADRAVAEARSGREEAAARVETARSERDEAGSGLQRLAALVAGLAARLDLVVETDADPDRLGVALASVRTTLGEARERAERDGRTAVEDRTVVESRRGELMGGLGLDPQAPFGPALTAARQEAAVLQSRVDDLEQRVARVAELEKENAATARRREVYAGITDDLAPSRFLKFLLDEEREALADLGAERFELLSGGRYRFAPGGDFDVVDLAAAERSRRAASLSGGETFLASLALALALAEMVSRGGGRLDAFFLDEGFGSLDADHLDLAMEGIERLAAGADDRLVVVVSHVAEMRQRIEDLIELDRDPLTGDTIVRRA